MHSLFVARPVLLSKLLLQYLSGPAFWKRVDLFSRHPATLLVLGFILTAIVGATIQRRQQEVEKDRALANEANAAIVRVSQSVTAFVIRVRLAEGAAGTDELISRRKAADEAFITLNAELVLESPVIVRPFARDIFGAYFLKDAIYRLRQYVEREGQFQLAHVKEGSKGVDSISRCSEFFFKPFQYALDSVLEPGARAKFALDADRDSEADPDRKRVLKDCPRLAPS